MDIAKVDREGWNVEKDKEKKPVVRINDDFIFSLKQVLDVSVGIDLVNT